MESNDTAALKLPLCSAADLDSAVRVLGILPFFRGSLKGYSVQSFADPQLWFANDADGPWEWKGPVIGMGHAAYGKFFKAKAAYIRLDIFADFLNYRRSTTEVSAEGVEALGGLSERALLRTVEECGSVLSSELKEMLGLGRKMRRQAHELVDALGLDTSAPGYRRGVLDAMLTRLQMAGRLCIAGFEYPVSAAGRQYGWGLARYTTPEALYGAGILDAAGRTPVQSRQRMVEILAQSVPTASTRQIHSLIG